MLILFYHFLGHPPPPHPSGATHPSHVTWRSHAPHPTGSIWSHTGGGYHNEPSGKLITSVRSLLIRIEHVTGLSSK